MAQAIQTRGPNFVHAAVSGMYLDRQSSNQRSLWFRLAILVCAVGIALAWVLHRYTGLEEWPVWKILLLFYPVFISAFVLILAGAHVRAIRQLRVMTQANAQCTDAADEEMIREVVEKGAGFSELDREVYAYRTRLVRPELSRVAAMTACVIAASAMCCAAVVLWGYFGYTLVI